MMNIADGPATGTTTPSRRLEGTLINQGEVEHAHNLDNAIVSSFRPASDGVIQSLPYRGLPFELRKRIFSYSCIVSEMIHVYPVKRNDGQHFRLSRCGSALLSKDRESCECEKTRNNVSPSDDGIQPALLNPEILLVSKAIRQEALDLIFTYNHFCFMSDNDLVAFVRNCALEASKLRHISVWCRLYDSVAWTNPSAANMRESRKQIGHLKSLSLHCFLRSYSQYEKNLSAEYVQSAIPFAFPLVDVFECSVSATMIRWGRMKYYPELAKEVHKKLKDIFEGKYGTTLESLPIEGYLRSRQSGNGILASVK